MTIPQSDRDFLVHNEVYFEQARLGFLHGMPPATLAHMEHLYRAHLDRNFILTAWCSACVVDMMVRLSRWWDGVRQEEEATSLVTLAGLDFLAEVSGPISADSSASDAGVVVSQRTGDNRPKSRRKRAKYDE